MLRFHDHQATRLFPAPYSVILSLWSKITAPLSVISSTFQPRGNWKRKGNLPSNPFLSPFPPRPPLHKELSQDGHIYGATNFIFQKWLQKYLSPVPCALLQCDCHSPTNSWSLISPPLNGDGRVTTLTEVLPVWQEQPVGSFPGWNHDPQNLWA